jgi:hypothetical protein
MNLVLRAAAIGGLLCVFSLAGYSGILNKPAARDLKTVALISVSMNRDFYDVRSPQTRINLNLFGKKDDQKNDTRVTTYENLINYSIAAYTSRLDGVGNVQWLPVADILATSAYQKFRDSLSDNSSSSGLLQAAADLKKQEWVSAPNMARVAADTVTQTGAFISIAGAKDPRLALASLCAELNVDAVAILELDMAYRKLIDGADIISGIPAVPSVSRALVLIDKNGVVAVNSGCITKGQGTRFEGKSVTMLQQNQVRLDEKSIASYQQALDKSADDLKKRLTAEFSKMK